MLSEELIAELERIKDSRPKAELVLGDSLKPPVKWDLGLLAEAILELNRADSE